MSEDNKNLNEDLNEMLDDAKELASDAKEKASDFVDDATETVNEVADEVKETAQEFADGAKEVYDKAVHGQENKKVVAGILALLIGYLGIHKFILGYTKEGIIQIIITFVSCGVAGVIPFIEGIIYLTKSDEEFYNTYQKGERGWF